MKYLGKITGALIGLLAGFGIFGVVLGIILGHLADRFISLYGTRKKLKIFYVNPRSFPLDVWEVKTAGMVGLFYFFGSSGISVHKSPADTDSIQSALLKQYMTEVFRTLPGISASFLNLCIESCILIDRPADISELAGVYKSVTGIEERKSFLQFLIISLPEPGPDTLKPLCDLLKIEKSWVDTHIGQVKPESTSLEEDCTLLGISHDTETGEIKRIYRRLAAQFHPDSGISLNPDQQRQLNETFIRIQGAYLRVLKAKSG